MLIRSEPDAYPELEQVMAKKFIPVFTRQHATVRDYNGGHAAGVVAHFKEEETVELWFPAGQMFATFAREDVQFHYNNGRPHIADDVPVPGVTRKVVSYTLRSTCSLYPCKGSVTVDRSERRAMSSVYVDCGTSLMTIPRQRAAAMLREWRRENPNAIQISEQLMDGPGYGFRFVEPRRKVKVLIHKGRTHRWEVRTADKGECLFASDDAGKIDSFINDRWYTLPHGPSTLEGDVHEQEMIDAAGNFEAQRRVGYYRGPAAENDYDYSMEG
jgi:hypothetical protein